VDGLPVTSKEVAFHTENDEILSQVTKFVKNGWPNHTENIEMIPFHRRRHELTTNKNCILWGNRVVIPASLHKTLINNLHANHQGIVKMKEVARSYFWWQNLDSDIVKVAHECNVCQLNSRNPSPVNLTEWRKCTKVWERIHIDFAQFNEITYLIVIDSFSKWPEVFITKSSTAKSTISILRKIFSSYCIWFARRNC
jgi:hypothetical protein